jgi:CheY-like chemotaxis protein
MSEREFEAFEQQVRECLAHYYDYAFLHSHPLVHALAPDVSGDARRVQRFREVIEQAVESLKPAPESDISSKPTRIYNILFYRYVNQEQVQHLLHRLNVSDRQYYRDHNKAIQALSRALLEFTKDTQFEMESPISIQSEIQRIRDQTQLVQIDAQTFLQKTLDALQGLTERYHSAIDLEIDGQFLLLTSDVTVLRQTIIWILSQLIIQSAPYSQFKLLLRVEEAIQEECQFIFRREASPSSPSPDQSSPFSLEQRDTLHDLVQALEGRVEEDDALNGDYQLCLTVPLRKRSVLIIDDNPDAIALFRRYLHGHPYEILTADDPDRALQLARDLLPDLIVLDVILPQQDGWDILQSLKGHPSTRHIPVLVCSVLDSPELAHVLGADGFLRKPPSEAHFLDALVRLCQPEEAD